MSSRDSILNKVKAAQPPLLPLPHRQAWINSQNITEQFEKVLRSIGGNVYFLESQQALANKVTFLFPEAKRIVSATKAVEQFFFAGYEELMHHSLHDVDVAIIEAKFGVAENGAVWVTEKELNIRVLPFICEHLVVVLSAGQIVPTMHQAYEQIGSADYGFGVFIAGPSKTADIEQSLVLGAHGPKSMTVLLTGAG